MSNAESNTAESGQTPQGTDDGQQQQQEPPAPTVDELAQKVAELTEHSRKWEKRAKENFEKAKRLDSLTESQKSDEEKAAEALKQLEDKLAEAERLAAESQLATLRFKIAAQHSLSDEDAELFLTGTDEDTLTRQAEKLSERSSSRKPPKPNPAQGNRSGNGAQSSTGEQFANALETLF